jgi:uncharacterized membrane protein YbhN (UPF0104 family)
MLIPSLLFLFLGFIMMCENWRIVLKHDKVVLLTTKEGIISNGLSIFAKYIPGKLMTVLSRALYIEKKYNIPLKKVSFESLKTQLLSLWVGLLIGSVIFFVIKLNIWIKLVAIVFLLAFFLFLFSYKLRNLIIYTFKLVFKKDLNYPVLNLKDSLQVFPSFFLNWLAWCLGYYLLCLSIIDYTIPITVGLSFALASVIAILTLIAPGGIGVREAVLTSVLIAYGVDKQDAITLSIVSRLWFLIGEVFIFSLAMILNLKNKTSIT